MKVQIEYKSVPSFNATGTFYTVTVVGGTPVSCTCADFRYRVSSINHVTSNYCKHQAAVYDHGSEYETSAIMETTVVAAPDPVQLRFDR